MRIDFKHKIHNLQVYQISLNGIQMRSLKIQLELDVKENLSYEAYVMRHSYYNRWF